MSRTYWPCRVCGAAHTNPKSSSICPSCGAAESKANAEETARQNSPSVRWGNLWNVPERARDAFIAMEDDFGPVTVLDFMLAMHPEENE